MAYPAKYSREQRKKAYDLFWKDRDPDRPRERGQYTGKQIAQMTGVSQAMVYRIAHGQA
jgi:DNA-binding MurR/RpiR family transcriptional regulator